MATKRTWCLGCGHPQTPTHNDSIDDPCPDVCPECQPLAETFNAMYDLERDVQRAHATQGFGVDPDTRARAKADKDTAVNKLLDLAHALSPDQRSAYVQFRLAQKAVAQ